MKKIEPYVVSKLKKKTHRNSITAIKSMKGKNHKMKLTPKV